jgi:hypothetical protein
MFKAKPKWMKQIDESFLSKAYKTAFKQLLEERFKLLN